MICVTPICSCQKQITFSAKQFQLDRAGFKNTMKKIFKGSQTAWNKFLKPALKIATLIVSASVAAKTKTPNQLK